MTATSLVDSLPYLRSPSKTTHSFSIPPKTMSVPGPLIGGTIVYAIIGAVLMALTFGALVTGKLSKDNAA